MAKTGEKNFMTVEQLTAEVVEHIRKSKFQFMNIKDVADWLRNRLGDSYTSEISIAVKNFLTDHEKLIFYREDTYFNGHKAHYCVGSWLAYKGAYDNPIQAKEKMGMYSWMESPDEDPWEE